VTFDPATSVEVSDLTIDRSAEVTTAVVTDDVLFDGTGSLVVELTLAVLVIVPVALDATCQIDVIVGQPGPEGTVPSEQGNGVVHAPEFETTVKPGGAGSLTVTPAAPDGPLFVTLIV